MGFENRMPMFVAVEKAEKDQLGWFRSTFSSQINVMYTVSHEEEEIVGDKIVFSDKIKLFILAVCEYVRER